MLSKNLENSLSFGIFINFGKIKARVYNTWSLIDDTTIHETFFAPPPAQSFRKETDNIYVHYRRVFVEFVVLLTKIWPTNIDF